MIKTFSRLLALGMGVMFATSLAAVETWRHESTLLSLELTLYDDGTYRYRNLTGSCWLDWDDRGKWHDDGLGLLVLQSEREVDWPLFGVSSRVVPSVAGMRVTLVGSDGHGVPDAEVLIGDGTVSRRTDWHGDAEFSTEELLRTNGRPEWISFVSEAGAGFVGMTFENNVHKIQLQPSRYTYGRTTYFMRDGSSIKSLGGLRVAFDRCE